MQWFDYEDGDRFDYDLLDNEGWPFDIDTQIDHLFKHDDIEIIREIWEDDTPGYVATERRPAHWFLVGFTRGERWSIPLCPANNGSPDRCRPIGVYPASRWVITEYRKVGGQ